MSEKFRVHSMETKKDIAMETAEFIVGVNDEELEDPNCPGLVNITALLTDFLEARLHRGDIRLGVILESVHWYERGYSSNRNTGRRGVKVICRLGDCDWEGQSVDHECYYRLWKEAVIDTAKSLMTYLSQDKTKVYFRGERNNVTIVEKSYM